MRAFAGTDNGLIKVVAFNKKNRKRKADEEQPSNDEPLISTRKYGEIKKGDDIRVLIAREHNGIPGFLAAASSPKRDGASKLYQYEILNTSEGLAWQIKDGPADLEAVCTIPNKILCGTTKGEIQFLKMDSDKLNSTSNISYASVTQHQFETIQKNTVPGAPIVELNCMSSTSNSTNLLLVAGRELEAQLWDLNAAEPTKLWVAKNVRDNEVKLREKVWNKSLTFLPRENSKFITVTHYGEIKLYDTKKQRRPVHKIIVTQHRAADRLPFNLVTSTELFPNSVFTSDIAGNVCQFDIRTLQQLGSFKGGIGASVRSLSFHPTKPLMLCASLDRFLRIFDVETRKITAKMYLKQKLSSCLLLGENAPEEVEDETDQFWQQMETVEDATQPKEKKKKRPPAKKTKK